jgi:serine protease
MSIGLVPRMLAAVVTLAVAGMVLPRAQTPESTGRTLAQPLSPPAIDRGLNPDTTVPEPRSRRTGVRRSPENRDGSARNYLPGRVLVKFRSGGAATSRASAAGAMQARSVTRPTYADFDIVEIDPALDAEAVAAELSRQPDVEYAQADYLVRPYFHPNDPLYQSLPQWNLIDLGMEAAWDINQGGTATVVVAVLDSGVAFQNAIFDFTAGAFTSNGVRYPALGRVTVPFAVAPELAGQNRFVTPHDFIWNDDSPVDLDGHGTHVAGTIGQDTNNNVGVAGVAFNVRLMPVKVVSGDWDDIFGSPFVGTDDVVARGIRYAVDNGAKVINMSIGRDGPPAPVVGEAMRYAVSRGAFLAVAGGNDFEDGNPVEALAQQAAPIEGAVVVAATGRDQVRAFYSGVKDYIEIAAPGGNNRVGGSSGAVYQQTYDSSFTDTFLRPVSQYGPPRFDIFMFQPFQGTSMATPHVSGLAALLYGQGITNPAAIEAALKRFATDKGPAGRDNEYGFGLINPRATLRGLGLIR